MRNHLCPRCGCSGVTIDTFRRRSCILCGWQEPTADDTDDDPDILGDLYPARSPLLFMSKQNTLTQLNFGIGSQMRK
jgi:hypothetical protein